ncbi:hypothetical protein RJ45_22475 [Photobacterium gaetbulicola]|uniref:ABC transporter ATP-binding protein n=2 Tax=Photobacterium gaetbulicola TaxID=1295392 RepID=A0A0B9FZ87_9GAMM|nr:hypothetical protein RJ45_22475 [Photobacterium gaetbulicola]
MLNRTERIQWLRLVGLMGPHRWHYLCGVTGHALSETLIMISLAFIMRDMIQAITNHDGPAMYQASLMLIGLATITCVSFMLFGRWFFHSLFRAMAAVRLRLFRHLENVPLAEVERYHKGELIARINSDVDAVSEVFGYQFRQLIFTLLTGVIAMVALLVIDVRIGAVLIGVAGLTAAVNRYFARRLRGVSQGIQRSLGRLSSAAVDAIHGAKDIRVYQMQGEQQQRYDGENRILFEGARQTARLRSGLELGNYLLRILSFSGLLVVGAWLLVAGDTPLGDVVAMIQLLSALNMMFRELGGHVAFLQKSLAGAQRIFEMLSLPTELTAPEDGQDHLAGFSAAGPHRGPLLAVDNVSFAYPGSSPVLHRVSLVVKPGETVAIVGPSGSGKSTLMKLLLGLYIPSDGQIRLQGQSLPELGADGWRRHLAYVPQDAYLFALTVGDNLSCGERAEPDPLRSALARADAGTFVQALPAGIDTLLSEGGGNLSGGQRQRLAVARALAKDADLLLMDEPTSALDQATELRLHSVLAPERPDQAVIIVAHRLATIRHADHILMLQDGRVVEEGDHATLMAQQGTYYQWVSTRIDKEENQ